MPPSKLYPFLMLVWFIVFFPFHIQYLLHVFYCAQDVIYEYLLFPVCFSVLYFMVMFNIQGPLSSHCPHPTTNNNKNVYLLNISPIYNEKQLPPPNTFYIRNNKQSGCVCGRYLQDLSLQMFLHGISCTSFYCLCRVVHEKPACSRR